MQRRFRTGHLLAWTLTVVTLLALARIAAGPLAGADPPPPYTLVDQIGAQAGAIAGDDRYVYLAVGSRLQVWDMADADAPRQVGEGPVTGWAPGELAVDGARAFALADMDGRNGYEVLQVHDIAEPRSPRPAGRLMAGTQSWDSAVAEASHAFVMQGGGVGLQVMIATDPDAPAVVASIPGGSWRLAVRDGLLGQLSTSFGSEAVLQLVDVSRPSQPRVTGRLTYKPASRWPGIRLNDVALFGHHAYIAGGDAPTPPAVGAQATPTLTPTPPDYISPTPTATPIGWRSPTPIPTATAAAFLRVVNVADRARPVEVGALFGGAVNGSFVAARDGLAVVQVVPADQLRLVDVTTPDAPRELARMPAAPRQRPVLVGDRLVLLENIPPRLRVVDIADPAKPRVGAEWPVLPWAVTDLLATGDWLYVADTRFGLRVLDLRTLEEVREVGQLALPQARMLATVPGEPDIVYVSDQRSAFVVDVHDPSAPQLLAKLQPAAARTGGATYFQDLTVTGGYLVAAAGTEGLWVADVSDPTRPQEVGRLVLPDQAHPESVDSVAAGGSRVFVGSSSEKRLYAVDISDPTRPREVGGIDLPWAVRVLAHDGGFVYAGSANQLPGLYVIDARIPDDMRPVGGRRVQEAIVALALWGDLAYAGGTNLQVLDIALSGDPLPVASVLVPRPPGSQLRFRPVAVTDKAVFIADNEGGGITVVRRSGELAHPTRTPVPTGYFTTTPSPSPTPTRTRTPRSTPSPTGTPVEPVARCYLPWTETTYLPTAASGW